MGNVSKFREVRSKLNSRSIRALARSLPWPYNGMLNDILGAIQSGGNYLAALGLASYTEVCGRQIFFNGDNKVKDWKCFNRFIHFMGAGEALKKKLQFEGKKILFKDAVRNGLVHRYFMKVGSGAVAMYSFNAEAKRTGFLIKEPNQVVLVVIPYFALFCAALKQAKEQGLLKWNP